MLIIKIGGGEKINLEAILADFTRISGKKILVHGANFEMDKLSKKLNNEPKEIVSPSGMTARYTDKAVIEIFTMVYPGLVNSRMVSELQKLGVDAVGLSGIDGKIWQGERKKKILAKDESGRVRVISDNLSGKVSQVNEKLLNVLLENDFIPVISSPGISFENDIINVDNDIATAEMAGKLGVKEIVMLFEAPGFMRDFKDQNSKIDTVKYDEIDDLMKSAVSTMKKKMISVKRALELGVEKIYFGDARIKNPIQSALSGNGTIILK